MRSFWNGRKTNWKYLVEKRGRGFRGVTLEICNGTRLISWWGFGKVIDVGELFLDLELISYGEIGLVVLFISDRSPNRSNWTFTEHDQKCFKFSVVLVDNWTILANIFQNFKLIGTSFPQKRVKMYNNYGNRISHI